MFTKYLGNLLFLSLCVFALSLSLRGIAGNPTAEVINDPQWKEDGPFELSPERGKFALALSMVENKSFHFSVPIAQFATPDLGYKDGNYVSLFAPGVSFFIIPGYLLGKMMNLGQVGAFSIISLFAVLNAFLIRTLALKFKVHLLAAYIAAFTFLFATPSFPYAVSLYQHQISTFLLLLALYTLLRWNSLWSCALIWFCAAISVTIDNPNLIFMLPIALFSLGKIVSFNQKENYLTFDFRIMGLLTFLTAAIPLSFFLWFNQVSYNNPFQLAGTVKSIPAIDDQGKPLSPEELSKKPGQNFSIETLTKKKTAEGFFKTRNLVNGFYIQFISPDRGVLWFTPIIFFSLFGMRDLWGKDQKKLTLLMGIVGSNILLYAMWGDPWGGWAFGERYLIPTYAIASIFIAIALTHFRKNYIFLLLFLLTLSYSVFVNTAGALSTNSNPPQIQVLSLEQLTGRQEKYTYARNLDFLKENHSKSFIWQTYGKNFLSATQYFEFLYILLISAGWFLVLRLWLKGSKENV